MAVQLSKERFDGTEHGVLISWGIIENSPDGVYMTSEGVFPLIWWAWKGLGNDWAIYVAKVGLAVFNFDDRLEWVHATGNKVHDKDLIVRMIDADPEVLSLYRR